MFSPFGKKVLIAITAFIVILISMDIGWRLRGSMVGLAPLERTMAMSTHPDIPKTVHVYWVGNSSGIEVRAFVYEGGPGIMNYGHDLGTLGQATNVQAAAKQFGVIRWTPEGLRIGDGSPNDRIVLKPEEVQSLR